MLGRYRPCARSAGPLPGWARGYEAGHIGACATGETTAMLAAYTMGFAVAAAAAAAATLYASPSLAPARADAERCDALGNGGVAQMRKAVGEALRVGGDGREWIATRVQWLFMSGTAMPDGRRWGQPRGSHDAQLRSITRTVASSTHDGPRGAYLRGRPSDRRALGQRAEARVRASARVFACRCAQHAVSAVTYRYTETPRALI